MESRAAAPRRPVVVRQARSLFARMKGLLGCRALSPGEGLLILPCASVHTVGMRFPLDLRFYDRAGHLVREVEGVRPGRLCVWGGWRAHCVLECQAGDKAFAGANSLKELI